MNTGSMELVSTGLSALSYAIPGVGAIGMIVSLGLASMKAAEARRKAREMLRQVTERRLEVESSSAVVEAIGIQIDQIEIQQAAAYALEEEANRELMQRSVWYVGAFSAGILLRRVFPRRRAA